MSVDTDDWFYLLRVYDTPLVGDIGRSGANPLLDDYLANTLLPALDRLGCGPTGVFVTWVGQESLTRRVVITGGPDLALLADLDHHLDLDDSYRSAADPFVNADNDRPPFGRIHSTLLRAMPSLARLHTRPDLVGNPNRLFELRRYYSPTLGSHERKVEMFVEGEADILDRTGLTGVMYASDLVGSDLPCLTYLWCYEDLATREAGEARWFANPEAHEFFSRDRYKNTRSTISNEILKPLPYSQV
ncbi:NIPSNAP family protein [Nonomuraea jabiensis]|uniref:NIPSNAP family protein n=1 Tax=Nonomuraea jabiensis TaxID=882448 RepID=UPI00343F5CDC